MRNLNDLSQDEIQKLQIGDQLTVDTERSPDFRTLYPTQMSAVRLNDHVVASLLAMSFPPMPQIVNVVDIDDAGSPTLAVSGLGPRPPVQVELAHIRMDARLAAQLAGVLLQQALSMDSSAAIDELNKLTPGLKDYL